MKRKRILSLLIIIFITLVFTGDAVADKLSKATFNTWTRKVKDALKDGNTKEAIETIGKLAEDDSERLVKFFFSLSSRYYSDEIIDSIKQALGKISDHDGVRYIVTNAVKAKAGLRVVLADVLASIPNDDAFKSLLKLLDLRDADTVKSAAKAVARKRDKRAVDNLINALEYWQDRDQAVVAEIRYGLIYSTGADGSGLDKADDWRSYWRKHGDDGAGSDDSSGSSPVTANPKPDFFGTSLSSMRFVFIIDISGSMNVIDPGEGGSSADSSGRTAPAEDIERERAEAQTRIGRTKAELVKAIKSLSKDVKFNIIIYNHDVNTWKPDLQQATEGNKNLAVDFVKALTANGLTHTDDALRNAFKNKDADHFILLSDGAPTHMGGDATEEWGGHEDSRELIKKIYDEVAELNRMRNVRIDTIGFSTANFDFMRKLAADNGGSCVELK